MAEKAIPDNTMDMVKENFLEAVKVLNEALKVGKPIDGQIFKAASLSLGTYLKLRQLEEQERQFRYSVLSDFSKDKNELRKLIAVIAPQLKLVAKEGTTDKFMSPQELLDYAKEHGLSEEDVKNHRDGVNARPSATAKQGS